MAVMKPAAYMFLILIAFSVFLTACRPDSAPKMVTQNNNAPKTTQPMQPTQPRQTSQTSPTNSALPPLPASNQTAPTANLKDLGWQLQSGKNQKLSDLKGKVVVLDFWATYCPPCLEEIPHLVELQNKNKKNGLAVIGLNVGGDEDKSSIPKFVKKLNIKYDLGYPDEDLVTSLFGETDNIPQTFVFDRSGKLVKHVIGYGSEIKEELDMAIQRALAN
jgi:thiol-disulfide isomerase/thioredoxin